MSNIEIERYQRSSLAERATYAQTLAGAADLIPRGLFDKQTGKPSPAKILLVMETGAMLGLHPMAALQGIDVIEGKATISPQLMTGLIRSAGHRLIIEKTGSVAEGTFSVTVTGTRADTGDVFTDTWDLDRAVRAGLCALTRDSSTGRFKVTARSKSGEALPWEKYPELVSTWRAIGVVGREGFDDVLKGISYMPEELDIEVGEDGMRVPLDEAAEQDLIDHITGLDDKADMATVWHEQHPLGLPSDIWTDKVASEFNSHLSTLTKDSRPPKPGAPGHTGDDAIDQKQIEAPADEAAAAELLATVQETEIEEEATEMTEEEYEAWSAQQFAAEHADGLFEPDEADIAEAEAEADTEIAAATPKTPRP